MYFLQWKQPWSPKIWLRKWYCPCWDNDRHCGWHYILHTRAGRYRKRQIERLKAWQSHCNSQWLGCSIVFLPSLMVAVFQWMLTQMMRIVLSGVQTQAGHKKDSFTLYVALTQHFVAPTNPTLYPYWSACGIGVASKNYLKWQAI